MNVPTKRLFLFGLAAFASLAFAGCFGNNTSAIQGKWSLDPASPDGCPPGFEFTATSMTSTAGMGIAASSDVTYKADGSNIVVSAANAPSMTFTVNGNELDMVQPMQCKYEHAQ